MPVPAYQVKNVNKWRAGIIEAAQGDKIIKYCLILLRTKKKILTKSMFWLTRLLKNINRFNFESFNIKKPRIY